MVESNECDDLHRRNALDTHPIDCNVSGYYQARDAKTGAGTFALCYGDRSIIHTISPRPNIDHDHSTIIQNLLLNLLISKRCRSFVSGALDGKPLSTPYAVLSDVGRRRLLARDRFVRSSCLSTIDVG
jgi:hypothetical protein